MVELEVVERRRATLREVYVQLRAHLEDVEIDVPGTGPTTLWHQVDYCSYTDGGLSGASPFPDEWSWIAAYAVTGSSEGHYIHVDLVRPYETTLPDGWRAVQRIFTIKTFAGFTAAWDICREVARFFGA